MKSDEVLEMVLNILGTKCLRDVHAVFSRKEIDLPCHDEKRCRSCEDRWLNWSRKKRKVTIEL